MESTVGLNWAFSLKRQSAYATANPDGDLNQSHPFEGADFADNAPNMSDNAAQFGKGHEFATRNAILSWDVRFKRTFQATTKMLGWAFAFHGGKIATTSLGGSPTAYSHVIEYQDPNGTGYYGSGRQLPVTTIVERVTSGLVRKFPSCLVQAVEVTGTLNDWVKMAVDMVGSGKKEDLSSGWAFPASAEGALLRNASLTFTEGASGLSMSDISCSVRSWRFRSEYQLDENGGYCPGSGYQTPADPTSGQVRGKLEFTRRAVIFEAVLTADSTNHSLFATLLSQGTRSANLAITGSLISGANSHALTINIPALVYKAIPIGADGDTVTFALQVVVFYDTAIANPFRVTVVNDTASYLVSS
jgi:hypothetical protein